MMVSETTGDRPCSFVAKMTTARKCVRARGSPHNIARLICIGEKYGAIGIAYFMSFFIMIKDGCKSIELCPSALSQGELSYMKNHDF